MKAIDPNPPTPQPPARIWPPPWWSSLSLLALALALAALMCAGITIFNHSPQPAKLPTPILLMATPSGGQAKPETTRAAPGQFAAGDWVRVSGTGGLDLRVRAGPGTLYETVQLISEGTQLEITGDSRQADNYLWWPVRNPMDNMQGWVVADYLQASPP